MSDNVVKVKIETEGMEELNSDLEKSGDSVGELSENFGLMNTKAGKAFSSVVSGAKMGVKSMTTLKGAIISTGIGALLIAVVALTQYFTKTERGAKALRVGMAVLGAVVGKLMDYVIGLGEGLFKLFSSTENLKNGLKDLGQIILDNIINRFKAFAVIGKAIVKILSGDLSEGFHDLANGTIQLTTGVEGAIEKFDDMTESAKELMKALAITAEKAAALETRQNNLNVAVREAALETAKLNGEFIKYQTLANDVTLSDEKRIAALDKMNDIQNKITEGEIARAKEQYEIIKAKNKLSESSEEDLQAEADAQVKIQELENQRISRLKLVVTKKAAIMKAAAAKEKAIEDKKLADQKKAEDLEDARLKKLEDDANKEIDRKRKVLDSLTKLDEEYYALGLETDEERREFKLELEQKRFDEDLAKKLANEEITQNEMEALSDKFYKLRLRKQKIQDKQEAKLKDDKRIADEKLAIESAAFKLDVISQGLGVLAKLLGEETKMGKAAATASVALDAASAIIGTWAGYAKMGLFGTIQAGIQTVAIGAMAVNSISQINKVKEPASPNLTTRPRRAEGGWIGGSSHSNGGTNINAEKGEFIVNANTMASEFGNMIVEANAKGNGANGGTGSGTLTLQDAVNLLNSQQVYVLESSITEKQKEVSIRESQMVN